MENLTGKRLLILGGPAQCRKVVDAAKKLGIYTIITDISPNKGTMEAADEVLTYSVMDPESIIRYCEAHPVDGVLNFCVNGSQRTQQAVCEHFGFPCFGDRHQYDLLSVKEQFKALCIRNGVDIIPTYSEAQALAGDCAFPILIKPSDSAGSRGISICEKSADVAPAIDYAKKESTNGNVIIEKCMIGKQDVSISFVVVNGEPHLVKISDRHLGKKEDNLNRQAIGIVSPSRYYELFMKNVYGKVVNMIRNAGFRNGPVSMQGFVDGDTIRFYDPAFRFFGGEYELLLAAATGYNAMEEMCIYALTGEFPSVPPENVCQLGGKHGLELFIDSRPGEIGAFRGLEDIAAFPETVNVSQKHFVGDVIPATGDIKQRICELDFLTESPAASKEVCVRALAALHVADREGVNMLTSLMDPEKI